MKEEIKVNYEEILTMNEEGCRSKLINTRMCLHPFCTHSSRPLNRIDTRVHPIRGHIEYIHHPSQVRMVLGPLVVLEMRHITQPSQIQRR